MRRGADNVEVATQPRPAREFARKLFYKKGQAIEYGALAQSVEHLTFNQVVRGSNPRCFIGMEMRKTLL